MIKDLYKSILTYADETAFFIDGRAYSYLELRSLVQAIQQMLKEKMDGEERLGIWVYDDFHTYASIVACLLSGIAFVPIEPGHPAERNKSIIQQAGLRYIISSQVDVPLANIGVEQKLNVLSSIQLIGSDKDPDLLDKPSDALAYILFTSGTTGAPKGVPISRKNLESFLRAIFSSDIKVQNEDRFLQVFDLTFDLSIYSYLVPLIAGASVYTLPRNAVKYSAAIELLEKYSLTHVLTVPSFLSFLRPYFKEIHLPFVKQWLFCGESLKSDMVKEWQPCLPNARILNVYGPTEATIFCSSYQVDNKDELKEHNGVVCIGKPYEEVHFKVLDNSGVEVAVGAVGELCISGSQTTAGYLGNDERNRNAFLSLQTDGIDQVFYRTGDLAFCDPAGDFFFAGRLDSQVKIQGFRVEIGEIEHAALSIDGVLEAVVVVKEDKRGNPVLYLFLRTEKDEIESISADLKQLLPSYMLPGKVIRLESFPLNLNGKIDKKALLGQLT